MDGKNVFYFITITVTNENWNGKFGGSNVRVITYGSNDVSSETNEVSINETLQVTVPRLMLHEIPMPTKGTRKELLTYANKIAELTPKK